MNLETHQASKKQVNFDDFDIEDIPFKPINEGLGFHHGKSNTLNNLKTAKIEVTPTQNHINNFNKVLGREKEMSVPTELEAFYRKGTEKEIPQVNREIEINSAAKAVPMYLRFGAFVVDMTISMMIFAVIISSMFLASGMSFESFLTLTLKNSSYRYLITLFVLIHLIYRVTSVYRSTLGQFVFGLKPKQSNEAAFNTIIERTLFEFLSIPLLGLPYLLGLDKKFFGNNLKKK